MPIAASLSPAAAVGAVWLGMVGGGYPDWVDLRSDLSSRLKHRGISHSLIVGALLALGLYFVLELAVAEFSWFHLAESEIYGLSLAFGAGFLSHILADACTHAGVRPLLPVSNSKIWIRQRHCEEIERDRHHRPLYRYFAALLSLCGLCAISRLNTGADAIASLSIHAVPSRSQSSTHCTSLGQ